MAMHQPERARNPLRRPAAVATPHFPFHPVANLFPLLDGNDFRELKRDIREQGLCGPIWTYKGQIIDGRNRSRACADLGIEPTYREGEKTVATVHPKV